MVLIRTLTAFYCHEFYAKASSVALIELLCIGGRSYMGIRCIVNTDKRFRVFDLTRILKIETGDGIGRKAAGGLSAANYACFAAETERTPPTNPPTPGRPVRSSFVSLKRHSDTGQPPRRRVQPTSFTGPRRFVRELRFIVVV